MGSKPEHLKIQEFFHPIMSKCNNGFTEVAFPDFQLAVKSLTRSIKSLGVAMKNQKKYEDLSKIEMQKLILDNINKELDCESVSVVGSGSSGSLFIHINKPLILCNKEKTRIHLKHFEMKILDSFKSLNKVIEMKPSDFCLSKLEIQEFILNTIDSEECDSTESKLNEICEIVNDLIDFFHEEELPDSEVEVETFGRQIILPEDAKIKILDFFIENNITTFRNHKKLKHYKDRTSGLWATDLPDKIPEEIKHLFFKLEFNDK